MMNITQKFSPQARSAARQRVLQALYQWQMTGQNIATIENQFLDEEDMRRADIPYFQQLLHDIPAYVDTLDNLFSQLLDRKVVHLDPIELAILRIGCYELRYCPDIPWRVAINESVELAKKFGAEQSHKYVNGILDKVAHNLQAVVSLSE